MEYTAARTTVTVTDAPALTGDWYLYISAGKTNQYIGQKFTNGELTINNMQGTADGSGLHSIYVVNKTQSEVQAKQNDMKAGTKNYFSQGIEWFGGLYIDKANSSPAITWGDKEYYKENKFTNYNFPLIGTSNYDARGGFKFDGTNDVKFTFKNGIITIKILDGSEDPEVTFSDQSYIFFNKAQKLNEDGVHGDFPQDNAHCYFYVWNTNTGTNAYSDEAFYWDTNILIAKMPAGNWTHCILFRRNTAEKNIDGCWNKTADIQLEEGKNYLTSNEATTWQNYTPRFYIASENGTISGGGNWNWNGNGTLHVGSFTKELSSGTYKFKVTPYVNTSGSTNTGWGTELNTDHFNSTLSNVSCWDGNNREIWFTLTATKDVTIAVSEYGVTVNAADPVVPETTYTVTIHPNGGTDVSPLSVGEGNTISSIASTYGNGTAKWYTDAELTHEFVLGSSTVTADMDLYAKWSMSGRAWLVGDLWMYTDGNGWQYYDDVLEFTTSNGIGAISYIAPVGANYFESYRDGGGDWWNRKITGSDKLNTATGLSWENGHAKFTLAEPKQVTISYDGKFSLATADYSFDNTKIWRIKTSNTGWGQNGSAWEYNTIMTNNGTTNATAIFRNVPTGTHYFVVTTQTNDNDAQKYVGTGTFNALYVDTSNPSSGLTWASATTNFGRTGVPQDDNYWRNCKFTLSATSDIRITFDGGKIRCDILPKYTVTFNSNGGSDVSSQTMFEGRTATEPSAPTKDGCIFVKWQLNGSDYNFSTPVTDNITLDAVWEYKSITSISLNETEHTTWVGNSDFTLTFAKTPSDLNTKSIAWSSNAEGVATVSNGTVHAVAAGEATITCTVTDQHDNVRTATCTVTVAACEMTTDNLYSMTVTGYNTSTGSSATLNGLWNESSENGVMTQTARLVRIAFKNLATEYMTEDADGKVAGRANITDDSDKWMYYSAGTGLFYLQNYKTGHYLYKDKSTDMMGQNGDWKFYGTKASAYSDADTYKWLENGSGNELRICNKDGYNNSLNGSHTLMRYYVDGVEGWNTPYVRCGLGGHQGNDQIKAIITQVEASVENPFFVASLMNTSYCRMNTNATVQANLGSALVKGAVITVRLYADAATSVKLTKTDGTEIENIALSADAALDYTYTVNTSSALLGESAFIIKAADNHAAIASIEVSRMHAANPTAPTDFAWETDLSAGITQSALGGTFQYTASSELSAGDVFYTSSDESVATVDADGTVHPIMAGTTTITALIEEAECYDEATITYDITLTEPTLAERVVADNGEGVTLTHDYTEDLTINKVVTINGGGHSIGNLTVETAGDLTIGSALTVADFTLQTTAGNNETAAASGQVHGAGNLTVSGNAYFEYAMDPDAAGGAAQDWYAFTVPFPVDANSGIARYEGGEGNWNTRSNLNTALRPEQHYAIMRYRSEVRAQGQYGWKKYYGTLQPGEMYLLTTNHYYNIYRFRMLPGSDLNRSNVRALQAYPASGEGTDIRDANWNALGNNMLYHAEAQGVTAQVVQWLPGGGTSFVPVSTNVNAFVVGTAFAIKQGTGDLTMATNSTSPLLAPARRMAQQASGRYTVQIAPEGRTYTDQLFVSASDEATGSYNEATDVPKMGSIGTPTVPQLWINAYDTRLCANQGVLMNGSADFDLGLSAPTAGSYTLTVAKQPEDGSQLWLTLNDALVWNLTISDYTIDLIQGNTTSYGLRIVMPQQTPTGLDGHAAEGESAVKYLRDGQIYILRGGVEHDILGR